MKKILFPFFAVLIASFWAPQMSAQTISHQSQTSQSQQTIKTEKMKTLNIESQSFTAYQEVAEALKPYIESPRSGDGALSRSAFYDHAHVVGSIDGEVSIVTADQFGETIQEMGPTKEIKYHIAWIDISGPAAAAKVQFVDWHGFRFTDFFVLYNKDGAWKISGKVYDAHSRN